ncbi:hypothetical protein HDV03_000415 [Kappamyces sp. JEL0829]|nr:hypothetical protein HDV03_000415 [Kappamyces sp. JEL0829]
MKWRRQAASLLALLFLALLPLSKYYCSRSRNGESSGSTAAWACSSSATLSDTAISKTTCVDRKQRGALAANVPGLLYLHVWEPANDTFLAIQHLQRLVLSQTFDDERPQTLALYVDSPTECGAVQSLLFEVPSWALLQQITVLCSQGTEQGIRTETSLTVARNRLLHAALDPHVEHVVWIFQLSSMPSRRTLQHITRSDKDIVSVEQHSPALLSWLAGQAFFPIAAISPDSHLVVLKASMVRSGLYFLPFHPIGMSWDTPQGSHGMGTSGLCWLARAMGTRCYCFPLSPGG